MQLPYCPSSTVCEVRPARLRGSLQPALRLLSCYSTRRQQYEDIKSTNLWFVAAAAAAAKISFFIKIHYYYFLFIYTIRKPAFRCLFYFLFQRKSYSLTLAAIYYYYFLSFNVIVGRRQRSTQPVAALIMVLQGGGSSLLTHLLPIQRADSFDRIENLKI